MRFIHNCIMQASSGRCTGGCWFTEADEWLNTRVTKRTTPECRNLLVVSAVYVEELCTT